MHAGNLIRQISQTLQNDHRVVFAYLYGSTISQETGNDIDIALFSIDNADPHQLAADIKIALHKATQIPPDLFDVRVLNRILKSGDIFSLLFLKNLFADNRMLVDNDKELRTEFIEAYGLKFRECEGLMQELVE